MEKPGPIGKFPEGKIHKDDEGALKMFIGPVTDPNTKEVKLKIHFGTTVSWLVMTADQAMEFAKVIRKRAKKIIQRRTMQ